MAVEKIDIPMIELLIKNGVIRMRGTKNNIYPESLTSIQSIFELVSGIGCI